MNKREKAILARKKYRESDNGKMVIKEYQDFYYSCPEKKLARMVKAGELITVRMEDG